MDVQYFLTIVIDGEPFLLHKVFDEIQYTVSEKKKKWITAITRTRPRPRGGLFQRATAHHLKWVRSEMRIWQNTSDPFRSLYKITALIEILFDYVHVADDGIYRSIDMFLKVSFLFFILALKVSGCAIDLVKIIL